MVKRKVKLCVCTLVAFMFVVIHSFLKNLQSCDLLKNNKNNDSEPLLLLTSPVQSSPLRKDSRTTPSTMKVKRDPDLSTVAPIDWMRSLRDSNLAEIQISAKDAIMLIDGLDWWKESLKKTSKDCPLSCDFVEDIAAESPYNPTYQAIVLVRDMFHSTTIEESDLENPNTKLIYYTLEAPRSKEYGIDISGNNAMLASYWRGSDFWTPYTKWNATGSDRNKKVASSSNHALGKGRLAVAVISNCVTRNDREWLISDLNRHIKVDTFGQCGNNSCKNSPISTCFAEISKAYKFYLAFENTNCRDYITEKYFRSILELNMIPVVMGAPKADYEALVPKGSFIHVDDFQSPKNLAEYLMLLDRDDEAYNEYFRWKDEESGRVEQTDFLCEVCAMVKLSRYFPIRSRLTEMNGFRWVSENEDLCLRSGQWNWNTWE